MYFVIGEKLRKQTLLKNLNAVIREIESQIQDLQNRQNKSSWRSDSG